MNPLELLLAHAFFAIRAVHQGREWYDSTFDALEMKIEYAEKRICENISRKVFAFGAS